VGISWCQCIAFLQCFNSADLVMRKASATKTMPLIPNDSVLKQMEEKTKGRLNLALLESDCYNR